MSDAPSAAVPWSQLVRAAVWRGLEGLGVLLACSAALLVCYPTLWWSIRARTFVRLTDLYRPGDYGGTLFLIQRALDGETGYRSTLLGHPYGFPFGGDFSNQLVTDAMAAFVRLLGMPLGYNVSVVAMLASNGLAIHLAARLVGARLGPALAAGVTVAVCPLVVEEILSGRPVSSWWAPAVAASALCVASLRSWQRAWLAIPGIACLALAVHIYAYAPVLLLPWTALAGVAALWPPRAGRFVRAAAVLGIAAAVAWWSIRGTLHAMPAYLGVHPDLRQDSMALRDVLDLGRGGVSFIRIPAITLGVAAVGSVLGWRRVRRWLPAALAAAALLVVALGPSARMGGQVTTIDYRMPWVWLMENVPLLWGCPRPTRYGMAGALMLSLWMGVALSGAWAWRRRVGRWLGRGLAGTALAGVMLQAYHVDPVQWYPVWPPFPQLQATADDGATLDLPLRLPGDKAIFSFYAYSGVPRVNPPNHHLDRWFESLDPYEQPLVYAAALTHRGDTIPEGLWAILREEGAREIDAFGMRHVVLHKTQFDAARDGGYLELLDAVGAVVVSDDDWMTIYELSSPSRQ